MGTHRTSKCRWASCMFGLGALIIHIVKSINQFHFVLAIQHVCKHEFPILERICKIKINYIKVEFFSLVKFTTNMFLTSITSLNIKFAK